MYLPTTTTAAYIAYIAVMLILLVIVSSNPLRDDNWYDNALRAACTLRRPGDDTYTPHSAVCDAYGVAGGRAVGV